MKAKGDYYGGECVMPKKSKFNPQVELKKAEEQYAQIQRRLVMLEGVILYLRKTIEECVEK